MESTDVAFWSMVGTGISAVATAVGVIVAICTLFSWRKQYIETLKDNFISSLVNYSTSLTYLPKKIDQTSSAAIASCAYISERFHICQKEWTLLERTMSKSKKYSEYISKWRGELHDFIDVHNKYIYGECEKELLKKFTQEMYQRKRE
ncbi:hypothetical protein [Serratia aquatilis]|uniref:DUF4760 domain-containing protein n=1 Tax=Serratia aquatilis TaxID=1737515 RepID=A0ABV6EF03_9GAMM